MGENTRAALAAANTPGRGDAPTLKEYVYRQGPEIERALAGRMDPDQFLRIAVSTIMHPESKLGDCEPLSIVIGLTAAAELGLTVSGITGEAYLIPRRTKGRRVATFQIGYRGFIKLAGRAGITVDAREVRDGDVLEYQFGTEPFLRHIPNIDDDMGAIRAFYAVAFFADGRRPVFDVRSHQWMAEFRDRFASTDSDDSPWNTDFGAMGTKTMIRRILNRVPMTADLQRAVAVDEQPDVHVDETPAIATPANPPATVPGPDPDPVPVVDVDQDDDPARPF